jgi:hypothetical protein
MKVHDGNVSGENVVYVCVKKGGVSNRLCDMSGYRWER